MSIFSTVISNAQLAAKKSAAEVQRGLNPDPRRMDPALAARAYQNIASQARGVGAGVKGNFLDVLRSRGVGRSGKMFGAAGAGAKAESDLLGKYNLGFDLGQQGFTEQARQSDIQNWLAWRNLLLRQKEVEYNKPPSFAIDTPLGGVSF